MATQALINLEAQRITRHDLDPRVLPDAVFWLDRMYLLEMDMGTESKKQLKKRVEKLSQTKVPVIWVSVGERRLETIKACCGPIIDQSLFTTLDNCRSLSHSLMQSQ